MADFGGFARSSQNVFCRIALKSGSSLAMVNAWIMLHTRSGAINMRYLSYIQNTCVLLQGEQESRYKLLILELVLACHAQMMDTV